jgi:hypothetical protein
MGITSTEAAWKQSSHKAQHRPQAVKNNGNAPEKSAAIYRLTERWPAITNSALPDKQT